MNQLIDRLRTCHVLLEGALGRRLTTFDLRTDQFNVLRALRAGSSRMSDLAARVLCDDSTTTRIVTSLERRRLVTRQPDPRDRRARLVRLTDAGTLMLAEAERAAELAVDRIALDSRLRATLVASLERLERALAAQANEENEDE